MRTLTSIRTTDRSRKRKRPLNISSTRSENSTGTITPTTISKAVEDILEHEKAGEAQRQEMDENTRIIEEKKAAEAAERKRQREEAKRIAAEEKAAQEMTSEEEGQEQQ